MVFPPEGLYQFRIDESCIFGYWCLKLMFQSCPACELSHVRLAGLVRSSLEESRRKSWGPLLACSGQLGRQFIEGGQTSTHQPRLGTRRSSGFSKPNHLTFAGSLQPHSTSGIRFRDNKTGRRKSGRIWPGRLYQKLPSFGTAFVPRLR